MDMNLPTVRLYNTYSRSRQELKPLADGVVRIYSCGPTVYRYVHVGNLRTFMLPDLLRRSLEYLGYETRQFMNITDVGHLTDDTFDRGEDKMLVSARLENKSTEEIAAYYTDAFMDDVRKINIRPAAGYPRATDHITQMLELIEKLIAKGHAYVIDGNVYFDIASFPSYGRLSRNTTDKLLTGVRGEPDPRKRHPGDFTLWKAAGEHRLQVWPSPWGEGFPGWHIECSAMSLSLLGERFDIHTGGADNVFPHHEAEIAQSEAVTGHRVVSLWMHGGLLMLSGVGLAARGLRKTVFHPPSSIRYPQSVRWNKITLVGVGLLGGLVFLPPLGVLEREVGAEVGFGAVADEGRLRLAALVVRGRVVELAVQATVDGRFARRALVAEADALGALERSAAAKAARAGDCGR